MKVHLLAAALGVLLLLPGMAAAEPTERVPLTENYSPLELTLISSSLVVGYTALLAGPRLLDRGLVVWNTPPGTLDYRISDAVHGDLNTGERIAGGLTDPTLLLLPTATMLYFGISSIWFAVAQEPMLGSQSPAIDHTMFSVFEAVGWTAMAVGFGRLLVRRPRPWVALERPAFARESIEPTTSLGSSHTALAAATLGVVSRSVWHQMSDRPLLVRLVPQIVMWGLLGFASFAHVADQENFLSDELVGLAVGTTFGNLAYSLHFDADGNPRRHHAH